MRSFLIRRQVTALQVSYQQGFHTAAKSSSSSRTTTLPFLSCIKPKNETFLLHRNTSTDSTTAFENYTLNVEKALMKEDEGRLFSDITQDGIKTLQGIGPIAEQTLHTLGLRTIEDLATYKFYHMAKSIQVLATTAEGTFRPVGSVMNVDGAVDKPFQTKTLKEILESPVSALRGLSEDKGAMMKDHLGLATVNDLADFKFCKWAESIAFLGKYEGKN